MRAPRLITSVLVVCSCLAVEASAGPTPATPGLRFGFAARTITPELGRRPVFLAGFGNDRRATGVHDDLWARAVAVSDGQQTVAIVAVDLIGLFHAEVVKARQRLARRRPGAQLIVASTHDHEGPDTMGLWGRNHFSSGVDPAYLERVGAAVVAAADEAVARLQPARLLLAQTRTPGLIEDGRLPRVIDDRLSVLQAVGLDGRTLGTVVDWSSHPEALGGDNTRVSSDYPSYLRARMERELGGTCVFLVGAVGGLMTPLGVKLSDEAGQEIPADSFAFAQAIGQRAAGAALAALRQGARPSASSALEYRRATVYLPLQNRLFRLGMFLGVIDRRLYSHGQPATSLFGDDLETEIGLLRLGDAEALLVPGEIYPELVLGGIQSPQDPAADFPGAPPEPPLGEMLKTDFKIVVGLANDEVGYLIPRSQWDAEKPFAYGRSEAQYGEVNSVGPAAAPRLAEAFARLLGVRGNAGR
ncbi:MAG TPA: hypothetical protein VEQ10_20935 [Vicinamibacteria bacterium]|nr:hypothetical protein [Vicinamibacteria bacterium]